MPRRLAGCASEEQDELSTSPSIYMEVPEPTMAGVGDAGKETWKPLMGAWWPQEGWSSGRGEAGGGT